MKRQKGFSLIELLIVVGIIVIIAAIAIPGLLNSRMSANEASAVASLRTIDNAELTYASAYPDVGYASALGILGPGTNGNSAPTQTNAALLDDVLGCKAAVASGNTCTKSGYLFDVSVVSGPAPIAAFSVNANPIAAGHTGVRYFYSDASAVLRYNASTVASGTDSSVQ